MANIEINKFYKVDLEGEFSKFSETGSEGELYIFDFSKTFYNPWLFFCFKTLGTIDDIEVKNKEMKTIYKGRLTYKKSISFYDQKTGFFPMEIPLKTWKLWHDENYTFFIKSDKLLSKISDVLLTENNVVCQMTFETIFGERTVPVTVLYDDDKLLIVHFIESRQIMKLNVDTMIKYSYNHNKKRLLVNNVYLIDEGI